ncbi:unnamed protein product [Adineta steineri]|uniref:Uncharacterized protein n=1 Tax=Adineta steineri TaxID=433720 RepID=A0A814F0D6_9BILA|nr:unnamed protein product [Adineta steineri]
MSTQSCAICGPKRTSRALCNCCNEYLCLDHLKEHDDLLNAQLEPLIDNINQLADRLRQVNIDSLLQPIRIQLDQWKQEAFQSIERIYEQKSNELNELISKKLNHLRQETEQIQTRIAQVIRNHDSTNEQIDVFVKTIQNLERETTDINIKPININIRPLILEDNYIIFNVEEQINNDDPLMLSPIIQTISSSANDVDCIACNDTCILLHHHPTLCLYDFHLNLIKKTHPYPDMSIADMCWSLALNRFVILTDYDVFVLNDRTMSLEKWDIRTRKKGHWHSITCSLEHLYLTAYKWGTNAYQFNIRPSSFVFNRKWTSPTTCVKDESIDHFLHNNNNNQIAMIVQNRINNNKHFQLRSDQTLQCIWSIELKQCQMTVHRNRFCSIRENEWLIIDSNQSHLLYISRDGAFKQIIDYNFNQPPRRAFQNKSNFLLVTTNHSVNLHQLL